MKKITAIILTLALTITGLPANLATTSTNTSCAQEIPETIDDSVLDLEDSAFSMKYNKELNRLYFLKRGSNYYSNSQEMEINYYDITNKAYKKVATVSKMSAYCADEKGFYYIQDSRSTKLESPATDGEDTYEYKVDVQLKKLDYKTEETTVIDLDTMYCSYNAANFVASVDVDPQGRAYVELFDDQFIIFNSDGTRLGRTKHSSAIGEIYGFDETNGNFYYRSIYSWYYWGYDHDMASLMCGNVDKNGNITMPEANLCMLYQAYFFERYEPVQMVSDKYLAVCNTFTRLGKVTLLNSNKYNCNDYTDQETYISLGGGVSVSPINIKDTSVIEFVADTTESDTDDYIDRSSYGTRCAVSDDEKIAYVKTGDKVITAYNIKDNKKLVDIQMDTPVYDFWMNGNDMILVGREGDQLTVETVDVSFPEAFTATAPETIQVGSTGQIECDANGFALEYKYETSDPSILTVDSRGKMTAWKTGEVTVSVTSPLLNQTITKTVLVTENPKANGPAYTASKLGSALPENVHKPRNAGYYGAVVNSYIQEMSDGTYQCVGNTGKETVIETYSKDGQLKGSKKIANELNIYGGAFLGSKYNFLVYGQQNQKESDGTEVIRVVRYDKQWNRQKAYSVYGANTYIPFDAGSASLTENAGVLYLHTCHEMYQSDDGYHHQANATFVINEETMAEVDSYWDVMNLSSGYVSHSFNQLINTDGKYIFRADLGDAYPRGIALTATAIGDKVSDPSMYGAVVEIPGSMGSNYTGFSLGGLELSDDTYILTGSGVKTISAAQSNIWTSSSYKESWEENTNWITNYPEDAKIEIGVPKLTKISANQFLLMWEEYKNDKYTTKATLLNAQGQKVGKTYDIKAPLSDCQPILASGGNVVWYVAGDKATYMVSLNPYKLEEASSVQTNVEVGSSSNGLGNGNSDYNWDDGGYTYIPSDDFNLVNKIKAPAVSLSNKKKRALKVTIGKIKGVTKYQIQYGTNKRFKKAKIKNVTNKKNKSKTVTIKKLKKGKKYYVRVRGVKGSKKGAWSKKMSMKVR